MSLVLVFDSLTLWTLVTVSVEWSRHQAMSWSAYVKAAKAVIANPVVAAILLGTTWGFTGIVLPELLGPTLELVSHVAMPLSLIALAAATTPLVLALTAESFR